MYARRLARKVLVLVGGAHQARSCRAGTSTVLDLGSVRRFDVGPSRTGSRRADFRMTSPMPRREWFGRADQLDRQVDSVEARHGLRGSSGSWPSRELLEVQLVAVGRHMIGQGLFVEIDLRRSNVVTLPKMRQPLVDLSRAMADPSSSALLGLFHGLDRGSD